jgi:hypothetical protein
MTRMLSAITWNMRLTSAIAKENTSPITERWLHVRLDLAEELVHCPA